MQLKHLRQIPRLTVCLLLGGIGSTSAAEVLLQEGFNDDGSAANPPRYSIAGGFRSEVPHDAANVSGPADQIGPVYWARNQEVSLVGVPAPTAGRRALLAWDGALLAGDTATPGASADMLRLVANTVQWLAQNKAGAVVAFSPNIAVAQGLADHLSGLGYSVVDDDGVTSDTAYPADVVIKGAGSGPSRFAQASQGVLVFSALDHDDMLTSSIGLTATFEPGPGTVTAPTHPVATGVPATFTVANTSANWQLMGDVLPGGSITVATLLRTIPPTAASLADVDAMVAGTKPAIRASVELTELDLSDGSPGDWFIDHPLPGGAVGVWGLVARGQLQVTTAGRYSFALGMDDGARLRIDRNRNGLGPEDDLIVEDVAGGHRARYGDAEFTATGLYDFEVTVFNSGGSGGIELSVSVQSGGADTSVIASGTWEVLGQTSGGVSLSGVITAESLVPSGPDQELTVPLLVLLNGPTDTPPGSVFGGGPFSGFEGTGFFAGSGLNKWIPETIEELGGYRSVRLQPINVTGKPDLKITIALAGSFLDFETSDFLDVVAYPQGVSGEEVRLARFSAPDGNSKYFVDIQNGNQHRLGLEFIDATYNLPAGATDLVIEIRSFTSWWNEIIAFDNIRITSGDLQSDPLEITSIDMAASGALAVAFTGGTPPFLVQGSTSVPGNFIDLLTTSERTLTLPVAGPTMVFRIQNNTAKSVKLFRARLTGAAERPTPVDTPATGSGWAALDGDTLTWYVHYQNLKAPLSMAHIHGPADVESAATVMVDLMPVTGATSGEIRGSSTVNQAVREALDLGRTYFNIHTSAHGSGEIRGQLGAP
jgi:hypothetical protein